MNNPIKRAANSIKNGFSNARKEAEDFLASELMEKLLPKITKLIPTVEREVKKYLGENEDDQKIIIIKREANGDASVTVLRQSEVELNFRGMEKAETLDQQKEIVQNAIIGRYSIEECAQHMVAGNMDKVIGMGGGSDDEA